jgi:ankyrin repeat protein/serine/threonine protein kinase
MDGMPAVMALPRVVDFLAAELRMLPEGLDAVRQLPVLKEGPLFSVKRHKRSTLTGRDFAIKVLRRAVSPGASSPPTEEELRCFLKQIKIISVRPLLSHPNIVDLKWVEFCLHCCDPFEISPAIVLERAPHGSLEDFQQTMKLVSWTTRKELCYDIAQGLSSLHEYGVLHGNLNRSHILIFNHPEREYMAKLTGFSDAVILSELEEPFTLGGAGIYRAPEIDENSTQLDQVLKTDIFSVGLLFWSVFTHEDFLSSFDLPLDREFRDNDVREILSQPYLFRFIPLIIEDKIGMLADADFRLLQDLFACTVRLSPRSRDLKCALDLLKQRSVRAREPDAQTYETYRRKVASLDLKYDQISVPINLLGELHFQVAQQYQKALESILDLPTAQISRSLRASTLWTLFLCKFHGYGSDRNPINAARTLIDHFSDGDPVSDLVGPLIPVLQEALHIEPQSDSGRSITPTPFDREQPRKIGPWLTRGSPLVPNAKEHGLNIDKATLVDLCDGLERGEVSAEMDCGCSNTLLHAAALFGLLDEVCFLVDMEEIDIDAKNSRGETALVLACMWGHESVVQMLLSNSADASLATNEEEDGLYWLCSFPQRSAGKIAAALTREGANVMGTDGRFDNLEWARVTPGLEFLPSGKVNGSPAMRAVGNRDEASLKIILFLQILSCGEDDGDDRLETIVKSIFAPPLRLACELHLFDIVAFLCEEFRKTLACVQDCSPDNLTALERLGDDPLFLGIFFADYTNSTALIRGAIDNSFQIQRYCYHKAEWKSACQTTLAILIRNGFLNESILTSFGPEDLLTVATNSGNIAVLEFLLELPPLCRKINDADANGLTMVHHAINSRQFEALEILERSGATIDLRNGRDPEHGLTAARLSYLHVLASQRNDDDSFINFILDQGVPATAETNQTADALDIALKRGNFKLARILIEHRASMLKEGRSDLTLLGALLVPGQAEQYDDYFSTFK